MDPSGSLTLQTEDETRVLAALLDAFHPVYSLQEIASAYCRAGSDLCKAGDMLCQLRENNSNVVHPGNDNDTNTLQPEESFSEGNAKDSNHNRESKPKKISATVGTVSTILGRAYTCPTSSKKGMLEATEPLKLEVEAPSVDELEAGSVQLEEHLNHKDTEEFLFSMLGDGFKISVDVIREVLGHYGYNVKKSMDELLALSVKTLDKGKRIDYDISEKHTSKFTNSELCLTEENHKSPHIVRKVAEPTSLDKERSDLPRELLVSLFNAPDRFDEEPKKHLEWGLHRTRVVGEKVVTKPLDDVIFKPLSDVASPESENEHVVDEEGTYWMLRRDVKEHWDKMKEFYEAAVEAYASGDRSKANDLLEEGRHHNQMAREADEKAAVEILETKKTNTENDIPLDLHTHSAKESIRLLKKHLVSFANIPMLRYLKVIVNTDAEDTTNGKRKRLVIKLLERESVKWTEEDVNPGTILIRLSEIDPSKFTFTNDQKLFHATR